MFKEDGGNNFRLFVIEIEEKTDYEIEGELAKKIAEVIIDKLGYVGFEEVTVFYDPEEFKQVVEQDVFEASAMEFEVRFDLFRNHKIITDNHARITIDSSEKLNLDFNEEKVIILTRDVETYVFKKLGREEFSKEDIENHVPESEYTSLLIYSPIDKK